jgi:hypothetical protein
MRTFNLFNSMINNNHLSFRGGTAIAVLLLMIYMGVHTKPAEWGVKATTPIGIFGINRTPGE